MFRQLLLVSSIATLTLAVSAALAQPGNSGRAATMLGKHNPFSIDDLPPGRARSRLESLPPAARREALEWMHRFDFPAIDLEHLEIDEEGGVFYADPVPADLPAAQADTAGGATTEAVSAVEDAFNLHSKPGAPNVVFLDFDGHTLGNTAWSSTTLEARPFDLDGSPSTFSSSERSAIAEIWHRVAEDFAAFDIDVTTEDPGSFGPSTGHVLITSKTDASGKAMPSNSGGGVAYIGVWGRSNYTYYQPALVYFDNLAKGTTYIAEASAHEFGHNLGLSHDGTSTTSYYKGHGSGNTSWAPIMGNSYYNNVTQWSRGEYADANNTQDDIAIITFNLGPAPDDHGDQMSQASPLQVEANGDVLVSNPETDPHDSYPGNKGVLETRGDVDLFYFSAGAGQLDLTVKPAWDAFYRTRKRGADLDIEVQLLDANGSVIATADPGADTYAAISTSVSAGTYYLAIRGVGSSNYSDYASVGEYFISGTIVPGESTQLPPSAGFSFACTGLDCSFSDSSSDSDGTISAWNWDFGDGSASTAQNPAHSYAAGGSYSVTLKVTDNDGLTASVIKNLSVSAPNTAPSADFSTSCTDLDCRFSDLSSDSDGSVTSWSWNFGDGSTSTAQNPAHSYASAGT